MRAQAHAASLAAMQTLREQDASEEDMHVTPWPGLACPLRRYCIIRLVMARLLSFLLQVSVGNNVTTGTVTVTFTDYYDKTALLAVRY